MNTYKITHRYSVKPEKTDIYINTFLTKKEIAEIIVTIQFMFEDLVTDSTDFSECEFTPFFEKFYNDEIKVISGISEDSPAITEIDRFYERETRCGQEYHELMQNALLKDENFINMIKQIKY